MIELRRDCLYVQQTSGETIPCSAEQISVELAGPWVGLVDPETIRQAAAAVLHHFKHDLGRDFVTLGEFGKALAKALRGLGLDLDLADVVAAGEIAKIDLRELASASGKAYELGFFPRMRCSLRDSLAMTPKAVHFHGLQGCVKQLLGMRRRSQRCKRMEDQIVNFLRGCFYQDDTGEKVPMLVE